MSTIIRIKENEILQESFGILQGTIYSGLDKTEIIRALIAEKVWTIKNQPSMRNSATNLTSEWISSSMNKKPLIKSKVPSSNRKLRDFRYA